MLSETQALLLGRLLAASAALPLAASAQPAAPGAKAKLPTTRPNVLIIYADDLGYADLACYGARNVKTPHIDRLASQGLRLTNAYAAAATSTPSRYGMLTGQYAWRRAGTDVAPGNAGMIIRPEQYTMADLFKAAGYRTAAFGKWHLGLGDKTGTQDWNGLVTPGLVDLGFDESYIMAATADRVPCVFMHNERVADYDPTAPIEVNYRQNFAGEPTGRTHPELLYNLRSSHGHDMSIVNGIGRIGYMKGGGKALWKDENIADSITRHAIDFIREQSQRAEPFFVYLATNDVHVPRFPHPRFRGQSSMGLRGDAIVQFDWSVGEVLRALDSLGIADNTLVVLSSDNGGVIDDGYDDRAEELLGGHNPSGRYRGYKYSAFEGGTRIPAIVRWPGVVHAGRSSEALVTQADWLASFAALLGVQLPAEAAPDSRDQLAVWLGQSRRSRPWILQQAADKTLGLRDERWKYIAPSTHGPMITWGPKIETGYLPTPQLYDLKHDPEERHNVADKHPKLVRRFQQLEQRIRAGEE